MAKHEPALPPGSPEEPEVFGKYYLMGLIARGGMAEVYRARPRNAADRLVAIKCMRPNLAKESKFVEKIRGDQNAAYLLFYQAVGWGQWALVYGKMKAVRKGAAGKIRRYSRACMAAWPKMEEGGPERVLGRLHHQTPRVPFITGWASNKKAMLYLRKAVEIGPENTLNQLFLAELLLDEKGKAEAKEIFQRLASMTPRPDHLVEDADAALAAKKSVLAKRQDYSVGCFMLRNFCIRIFSGSKSLNLS